MEKLIGNQLGPHESWAEYAEHSVEHDNYFAPVPTEMPDQEL